jgi:hypothetical protein
VPSGYTFTHAPPAALAWLEQERRLLEVHDAQQVAHAAPQSARVPREDGPALDGDVPVDVGEPADEEAGGHVVRDEGLVREVERALVHEMTGVGDARDAAPEREVHARDLDGGALVHSEHGLGQVAPDDGGKASDGAPDAEVVIDGQALVEGAEACEDLVFKRCDVDWEWTGVVHALKGGDCIASYGPRCESARQAGPLSLMELEPAVFGLDVGAVEHEHMEVRVAPTRSSGPGVCPARRPRRGRRRPVGLISLLHPLNDMDSP